MFKYVTIGWNALVKELWVQPKNRNFIKPIGGVWGCKYTPKEEFVSIWHEWCSKENFSTGRMDIGVVYNLTSDARIYTIDSYKDLEFLMEKYEDTSMPFIKCLDFEKLSLDYDVMELTSKGQWETRLSHPYNLYGWDVACILILNFDVISLQKGIKIKENK